MHIKNRHIDWQSFEMDNSWCSKPITSATLFSPLSYKRTTAELSPIDFTWQKTWNRLRASKPGFKPCRCDNKNQTWRNNGSPPITLCWTACFLIHFHVDSSVLGQQKVVILHQWCTDVYRFLKRKNSFNLWSSTIWAEQTSLKPPPLGKICFRTIWGTKMRQKHRLSPYIWEDMLEEPPLDYIGITHLQSKCRKLLLAKLPSSSASGASTRNHSNVEKHNQFKSTCGPNFTKKQHKTHTFPNKKNDLLKKTDPLLETKHCAP